MFTARQVSGGPQPFPRKMQGQGMKYASQKGRIARTLGTPTEDDLVRLLSTTIDVVNAMDELSERELPQSVIDGLPPLMRAELQRCRDEVRKWAADGGGLRDQLSPLLQQLQDRARAASLGSAKFKLGDVVDTPHGRGVVRDLMTENYSDGDVSYSVDGHVYSEEQIQAVTVVERLGDLADD